MCCESSQESLPLKDSFSTCQHLYYSNDCFPGVSQCQCARQHYHYRLIQLLVQRWGLDSNVCLHLITKARWDVQWHTSALIWLLSWRHNRLWTRNINRFYYKSSLHCSFSTCQIWKRKFSLYCIWVRLLLFLLLSCSCSIIDLCLWLCRYCRPYGDGRKNNNLRLWDCTVVSLGSAILLQETFLVEYNKLWESKFIWRMANFCKRMQTFGGLCNGYAMLAVARVWKLVRSKGWGIVLY